MFSNKRLLYVNASNRAQYRAIQPLRHCILIMCAQVVRYTYTVNGILIFTYPMKIMYTLAILPSHNKRVVREHIIICKFWCKYAQLILCCSNLPSVFNIGITVIVNYQIEGLTGYLTTSIRLFLCKRYKKQVFLTMYCTLANFLYVIVGERKFVEICKQKNCVVFSYSILRIQ